MSSARRGDISDDPDRYQKEAEAAGTGGLTRPEPSINITARSPSQDKLEHSFQFSSWDVSRPESQRRARLGISALLCPSAPTEKLIHHLVVQSYW